MRFPVCLLAFSSCKVNDEFVNLCCEMQLPTAIVPVLTTCAALNRVFFGISFVADGAFFAYSRHVAGGYGQSIIDELELLEVPVFQR